MYFLAKVKIELFLESIHHIYFLESRSVCLDLGVIRKVLGLDVSGIVTVLSKDFIRLVLVAIIIASPLS